MFPSLSVVHPSSVWQLVVQLCLSTALFLCLTVQSVMRWLFVSEFTPALSESVVRGLVSCLLLFDQSCDGVHIVQLQMTRQLYWVLLCQLLFLVVVM